MKLNKILLPIAIVLLIFSLLSPIIFTMPNNFGLDFTKTGNIGDTIGGITAPFINIAAAILVYLSFREQIAANKFLSKESSLNYIFNLQNKTEHIYDDFQRKYNDAFEEKMLNEIRTILHTKRLDKFKKRYHISLLDIGYKRLIFQLISYSTLLTEIKESDNITKTIKFNLEEFVSSEIESIFYLKQIMMHGFIVNQKREDYNADFTPFQYFELLETMHPKIYKKYFGDR